MDEDSFMLMVENLDRSDIDALCRTNRQFHRFCSLNKERIWKMLLRRDRGISSLADAYDALKPIFSLRIVEGTHENGNSVTHETFSVPIGEHVFLVQADTDVDALQTWLGLKLMDPSFARYGHRLAFEIMKYPVGKRGKLSAEDRTGYRTYMSETAVRLHGFNLDKTIEKNELIRIARDTKA